MQSCGAHPVRMLPNARENDECHILTRSSFDAYVTRTVGILPTRVLSDTSSASRLGDASDVARNILSSRRSCISESENQPDSNIIGCSLFHKLHPGCEGLRPPHPERASNSLEGIEPMLDARPRIMELPQPMLFPSSLAHPHVLRDAQDSLGLASCHGAKGEDCCSSGETARRSCLYCRSCWFGDGAGAGGETSNYVENAHNSHSANDKTCDPEVAQQKDLETCTLLPVKKVRLTGTI